MMCNENNILKIVFIVIKIIPILVLVTALFATALFAYCYHRNVILSVFKKS